MGPTSKPARMGGANEELEMQKILMDMYGKCLTGYYSDHCTLSVVKQPLGNCPSGYYSDDKCTTEGCFEVPCDPPTPSPM